MRLALGLLILAVLLGLALTWDRSAATADLRMAYVVSPQTLDPTQMQASQDIRYGYALFEGLASFDPYTFEVIPGVASHWDISDDRQTYTFHLRPEARWSNGESLTARDFVRAWQQNLMPDFAGPYHEFLLTIRGARPYFQWCNQSLEAVRTAAAAEQRAAAVARAAQARTRFGELVGVRVIDDHTIEVTLERPLPYFLQMAACWPLFPLPRAVIEEAALDQSTWMLRRDPQWTRGGRMISNGPYRLSEWLFKRRITLDRNEHYWNAGAVKLQRITAMNFADHDAAFAAYETGGVDLYLGATPSFKAELVQAAMSKQRRDIHPTNNWGTYCYVFNCRPKLADGSANPMADPRVRKAMSLAIDRQAIVEHVTREYQQVAEQFIPPDSVAGYDTPEGLSGTVEDARRLLAEAGYPEGKGLPPVVLMYNTGGGHEKTAQAIAHMWQKQLGVRTAFKPLEWKVFLVARHKGDYTVARSGWFGDYGDPTTFLDLFVTGNGNNDAGFSDPQYDRLMQQAATERDASRRMTLLAEAERYVLQEQVPVVPLYYYRLVHIYDPQRVRGVSHHPRNIQMLWRLEVVDR